MAVATDILPKTRGSGRTHVAVLHKAGFDQYLSVSSIIGFRGLGSSQGGYAPGRKVPCISFVLRGLAAVVECSCKGYGRRGLGAKRTERMYP